MRSVAEDDISAGVDSGMGDFLHVFENGLIDAPVTRGYDDIATRLERFDVVAETLQRRRVSPRDDRRRYTRPVERYRARSSAKHRHLIRRVAADGGDAHSVVGRFMIGRPEHRGALQ